MRSFPLETCRTFSHSSSQGPPQSAFPAPFLAKGIVYNNEASAGEKQYT